MWREDFVAFYRGANVSYGRWQVDAVIQITQPEKMCEAMSDVKRIELLITQIQEA